MKNSKKLFLIFLSVLIVAFVSCKKDSGGSITTPTPTFKPSSLVGSWTATTDTTKNTLDIKEETTATPTTCKLTGQIDSTAVSIDIKDWESEKDKDVQVYILTHTMTTASASGWFVTYTFKNSDKCEAIYKNKEGQVQVSETFTKNVTTK